MKVLAKRLHLWLGPLLIALTAIVMLAWTWDAWIDPVADFGRELYVPWRLAEGDVLYRDVAYFNGPVSPYINALIFRVIGTGIQSVVLANLVLWLALVAMVYHLWTIMFDRFTATLACLTLVTLFSFNRFTVFGNYTWAAPYSHEITHGIVMALAGLCCVESFARHGGRWKLIVTGLLVGMILLTKVEVALASALALSIGAVLAGRVRGEAIKSLVPAAGAVALPIIVAFASLSMAMPAAHAARGVLGSIQYLNDSTLRHMPIYTSLTGTDHPVRHAITMLIVAAMYCVLLSPAWFLQNRRLVSGIITAALMAAVCRWTNRNAWFNGIPPVLAVGVIRLAWSKQREWDSRRVTQLAAAVFSLLLLAKMALNTIAFHYGFALAMPATLMAIALASNVTTRGSLVVIVAVMVGWNLRASAELLRLRTVQIGEGVDFLIEDSRVPMASNATKLLADLPPTATLACVPDGAILNYLTRRVNPAGQLTLFPGELSMFGEHNVLDRFRKHPPGYILATRRDMGEFGVKGFGEDYARELYQWISENYKPVNSAGGAMPMTLLVHRIQSSTQASTRD